MPTTTPTRTPAQVDDQHIEVRPRPAVILGLLAAITATAVAWLAWRGSPALSVYGAAVGVIFGGKVILSLLPVRRYGRPLAAERTCVVVPIYNEDPGILARALASIDAQTHQPDHVVIVDDGSTAPDALDLARAWAATRPSASALRQPNAGKREAMARAFRLLAGRVDVWVCVDSDTVLDPRAIERGLVPFADPATAAVTGTVLALNPDRGLLPRLIDGRYVAAFLCERGAYSRLGAVLCVCGSLAFWRADIITEHLDDFTGQRFLGRPCTYGDDRHLTNLSLLHGQVVLARTAVARTAVPERLGHFLRQQARWGRSFIREGLWSLTHQSPRRPAWWLALVEVATWPAFTGALIVAVLVHPFINGPTVLVDYAGWAALLAYARSVHIFSTRRPGWPVWEQALTFATAPIYAAMHLVALLPLRTYSLLTLRQGGWGTRAAGAEVTAP